MTDFYHTANEKAAFQRLFNDSQVLEYVAERVRFELTVQHNCTLDFETSAYPPHSPQVLVNARYSLYASRVFRAFSGSDDRFLHTFLSLKRRILSPKINAVKSVTCREIRSATGFLQCPSTPLAAPPDSAFAERILTMEK